MPDCSNVDIRELLPERASGALSAADLARVEAHLADCATCASELALIQAARAALRRGPAVDVARIAGAVRSATTTPMRPVLVDGSARASRRFGRSNWIGWKAAAAVAIAAAGGGTMLFSHRVADRAPSSGHVAAGSPATGAAAIAPTPGTLQVVEPGSAAPASTGAVAVRPALNVAGGLSDLSDSDLRTLLDDIGSLGVDTQSFEEPQSMLPDLPGSEGTES